MAYYGAQKNNPELKKLLKEYESKLQTNLSSSPSTSPESAESISFSGCGVGDLITLAETTVFPVFLDSPAQNYTPGTYSATGPMYPPNGLTWVMSMGLRYQNTGCSWWANRLGHWGPQIGAMSVNVNQNNPLSVYQYQLKLQKHNFALQALSICACPSQLLQSPPTGPAADQALASRNISRSKIKRPNGIVKGRPGGSKIETILTTIGGIPLFKRKIAALRWAKSNNLTGFHTHTYKGVVGYMGGKTHSSATGSSDSNINIVTNIRFGRSNAATPGQGQAQTQRRIIINPTPPPSTGGGGGGGGGY